MPPLKSEISNLKCSQPAKRRRFDMPKELPAEMYLGNPPNCILIAPIPGGHLIGPGVLSEHGRAHFHKSFKPLRCATPSKVREANTHWRRFLGLTTIIDKRHPASPRLLVSASLLCQQL